MTTSKFAPAFIAAALTLGAAGLATTANADPLTEEVPVLNPDHLLFSLDIGSDTEISDYVTTAADEELDPGDIYAGSSISDDTFRTELDDVSIFGFDPDPIQSVLATAAPVGTPAASYSDYFDLDGYDRLNLSLSWIGIDGEALAQPILANRPEIADMKCVARLKHLSVSFHDDDDSRGWRAPAGPRIPVDSAPDNGTWASPTELVFVDVTAGGWLPALSEDDVHDGLYPTPYVNAEADDDVDAADYVFESGCNHEYFSADDEGPLSLHPGWVYEVMPGSPPAPRITNAMLGVAIGTDIDAVEFAYVKLPPPYGPMRPWAFALLYSVGADRPGSPTDESGGLNPGSVHASFLDGFSWEILPAAGFEFANIDAIIVYPPDADGDLIADAIDNCTLAANPQQHDGDNDGHGNTCDGDFNNDCIVNAIDLGLLRSGFFGDSQILDIWGPDGEPDGVVNAYDLGWFKGLFFGVPGPGAGPAICDA